MAPEVIANKSYDYKADIWSVGVTFFELLTGTYPFQGSSKNEIFQKMRTGQYQLLENLNLSPYCLDFLTHCLQYNPERRYSARKLLAHPYMA
jgi:serine/threonine protein kinase